MLFDRRHPFWFCVLLTLLIGFGGAPTRTLSGQDGTPSHTAPGHHLDAAGLTSGDSLPAPSTIKLAATTVEAVALPIPIVSASRLSIRALLLPGAAASARQRIRGPPAPSA